MAEQQEDKIFTEDDVIIPIILDIDVNDIYADEFNGPAWRNNGADSIIHKSLREIKEILIKMVEEGSIVNKNLQVFYAKYPSFKEFQEYVDNNPLIPGHLYDDEDYAEGAEYRFEQEELWKITSRFEQLEHDLACSTRTAILMAAIDVEACINRFCYYNLGEATTEAIERLHPISKLTVIHKVLGLGDFKGTTWYEAVKALYNWRNAFAHGKCTDMPTCTLKVNHLSKPKYQASSRDTVNEALKLLEYYVKVYSHLNEINIHSYTNGDYHWEPDEVKLLLKDVDSFK